MSIVWTWDIPPDEYVRCTESPIYITKANLRKLGRRNDRIVNVGYEAVPCPGDRRYTIILRYFWLTRRDHFFGGVGLAEDEWWSSPDNMPSEGIRVRDIQPTQLPPDWRYL